MMFLEYLTILFIGLKLTNLIDWSWWWVLSPIMVAVALSMVTMLVTSYVLREAAV